MNSKEKALEVVGCNNIESYNLVENCGYVFNKKNIKYDLRHWLNCYGEAVDFWELSKANKDFDTFEEAVKYIKSL